MKNAGWMNTTHIRFRTVIDSQIMAAVPYTEFFIRYSGWYLASPIADATATMKKFTTVPGILVVRKKRREY